MCGITGWFSQQPVIDADRARIAAMTASLRHRGPDAEQVKLFNHAAFGHTRLSILDIEGGAQPFESADGRSALVYNGEIYNHATLRTELEAQGHRFRTRSDTEVVLQVLQHWGSKGLKKLRGMYALAFWNHTEQRGLLARDPLGIKPLFVSEGSDRSLTFGSEAKAILKSGQAAHMDEAQLHLLMNFRYLPGQGALFRGIRQLAPGEILHWSKQRGVHSEQIDIEQSIGNASVIDSLRDSVHAHLVSDVPVGVYLSGGIDSAAIAALAGQPLPAFTLELGDDPMEADNAAISARFLGMPLYREAVDFDPETDLLRLLWHLELPKINALQGSLVARLASTKVKVVLSGLGGDELFMGYNAHRLFRQFNRTPGWAKPLAALGAKLTAGLSSTPWSETQRALRMAASGDPVQTYGLLRNLWDSEEARQDVYGERMLDTELPNAFDILREYWPAAPTELDAMRRFEWQQKMVNDLLWNEDRVSMAEGLEVRVPLVDSHLAARIGALSAKTLMHGGQQKAVLRDSLSGLLPDEILRRPKSGFQVDSPQFFQNRLLPMAHHWLSEDRLRHYRIFNPSYVARLRSLAATKRHRWHYFQLYLMLLTHLWVALFEEEAWNPT